MKFDVKVKSAVVASVGWSLVQRHHIRERHAPQIVVPNRHDFQRLGKIMQFIRIEAGQPGMGLLGRDITLVSVSREVRNECDGGRVLEDDPAPIVVFGPENILEQDATRVVEMLSRKYGFGLD